MWALIVRTRSTANVIYTNISSNPGPINNQSTPVLTFDYHIQTRSVDRPLLLLALCHVRARARHDLSHYGERYEGEAMGVKYERQRNRAMFIDAQGRPNRPLQHNPFVSVR